MDSKSLLVDSKSLQVDSKSLQVDVKSCNVSKLCTIKFKDGKTNKFTKKTIERFGLLTAQESKDDIYDLHTVDIEEFMDLLDHMYIPNNTFHLNMHNKYKKYKKLYDYLLSDPTFIRSKPQFINTLCEYFHKCIINNIKKTNNSDDLIKALQYIKSHNDRFNMKIIKAYSGSFTILVSCDYKNLGISFQEFEYYTDVGNHKRTMEFSLIKNISKDNIKYYIDEIIIKYNDCNSDVPANPSSAFRAEFCIVAGYEEIDSPLVISDEEESEEDDPEEEEPEEDLEEYRKEERSDFDYDNKPYEYGIIVKNK
jgi:hypothetical protein